MSDLRSFTLWARELLTREASNLLQQVYLLDARTGARLPIPAGHPLEISAEVQANRKLIEQLLDDEMDAGLKREEAVAKLIKETAFTHLNRLVAFKLMEARGLIRSPLAKHHAANGFIMWLGSHAAEEVLYNQGDNPNDRDGFGEAPRDRAYRHYLLWQCGELANEIKVLFDPANLPSILFPRPGVLRELIDALNAENRKEDWAAGNDETVGWVYQYFNVEEKAAAFDKVFKKKKKFEKNDLPAATQVFTSRWIVRFLVENSLGRHWLAMHSDSQLGDRLDYLVPLPTSSPSIALKPVKEIRVLDPATGTMHFGLVAFELLVEMYREELANVGTPGWPAQASVQSEAEIPGAILANNLFGIDIDLRAVQLAALALYLKAKATNRQSILIESNLACADVAIFRGQHLSKITSEMDLPKGVTRDLFEKFRDSLDEASMMGSLVRLDAHFQNFQSDQLQQVIDSYVAKKSDEGVYESYFANETGKGLRLLNVLGRRYDVVFTNPPYMSNRNMNSSMSEFMKRNYKKSKGDLYSAFIERCAELLGPEGRLAIIAQQSFMFISSFEDLRDLLLGATVVESMTHVGPRAFAEVTGEKVNTTAFVLRREQLEVERLESRGVYFRLVKGSDAESKRTAFEQALAHRRAGESDSRIYEYRQGDFSGIPGTPWVYWITPGLRSYFRSHPSLEAIAKPWVGLQTSDNLRFVRLWWEVGLPRIGVGCQNREEAEATSRRWFPYMKGGSFRRWYGNQECVVNWWRDGREMKAFGEILKATQKSPPGNGPLRDFQYYFRSGVTWNKIASGRLSIRLSPGGFMFAEAGSSAFPAHDRVHEVLGLLNSSVTGAFLSYLSPTLNYEAGHLAKLPMPLLRGDHLGEIVRGLLPLEQERYSEDETTYDFVEPPIWPDGVERVATRRRDLAALEKEIDEEVYRLYEISPEDRKAIEEELASAPITEDDSGEGESEAGEEVSEVDEASLTIEELGQRWISYAVGVALGRFARAGLEHLTDLDGLMVIQRDHPDDLAQRVIDVLAAIYSDTEVGRIIRTAIGGNGDLRDTLASYLLGAFFKAHLKRYRKRPVYWLLQSPKQNFSAYLFHERATDQTLALLQGKRYLGGRIFQLTEQLNQAKQKEMATEGREKAQWKRKAQETAEELSDLEAMQQALEATNAEQIVNTLGQPATARWVPEFDDGVLLNAAALYRLTPAWKKADAKLDLKKVWDALAKRDYPWAKTAMRYWPRETLAACKENRSYRIAHGLE